MRIDLPDELTSRLEHLAKGTGQDVSILVREAIEIRLAIEERLDTLLEDWPIEELRNEIQQGLESGPGRLFDASVVEEIKARGRKKHAAHQHGTS